MLSIIHKNFESNRLLLGSNFHSKKIRELKLQKATPSAEKIGEYFRTKKKAPLVSTACQLVSVIKLYTALQIKLHVTTILKLKFAQTTK